LTTFAPDDLYHILKAFSPALKSIDVRTVAVCPPSEEHWQNWATAIFLSDKTIEEIKAKQEKIPKVRNNRIGFFCDTLPFDYLIFDKISNGEIRFPVSSFPQHRIKTREFDPLTLKVQSSQKWINNSYCYILRSTDSGIEEDRKKLWTIVLNQDTWAKRYGFSNSREMITHYLTIDYRNEIRKDFEIVIHQFAKIQNLQLSENQLIVNVQIPKEVSGLQLNLLLKRDSEIVWRDTGEIDGTNNSKEFTINGMLPFDSITVELIHLDSGLTLDRAYETVPLKNVAEPLVKTLDAFCSFDNLNKMLFEPENYGKNPEKIFENAVTWLLSLSGYETVHLGIRITKLNGKNESFDKLVAKSGYHIGSADIIAYEENERILLIDCDIGTVDPKKVQKLAELKKHFRDKLKGYEKMPIVPILFSPKDFREASPSTEVMIADQSVIKRIFEAVVKGNREHARSLLYYSGW